MRALLGRIEGDVMETLIDDLRTAGRWVVYVLVAVAALVAVQGWVDIARWIVT